MLNPLHAKIESNAIIDEIKKKLVEFIDRKLVENIDSLIRGGKTTIFINHTIEHNISEDMKAVMSESTHLYPIVRYLMLEYEKMEWLVSLEENGDREKPNCRYDIKFMMRDKTREELKTYSS